MIQKKRTPDYSKKDFVAALRKAGISSGQTVLCHSNIGFFGIPSEGNNRETADRIVLEGFLDVIGKSGTLIVPTFTYSFCKNETFDPDLSQSTCGPWSEYVRTQSAARRSLDPLFSVAAIGKKSIELTDNMPCECFGEGSFWERFLLANGVICNLNVWAISTFVHYIEKKINVPYRYDKLFHGKIYDAGKISRSTAVYFCQDGSNDATRTSTDLFDQIAFSSGLAIKVPVGRGYITKMTARDTAKLIEETIIKKPYFLIEAGKKSRAPRLLRPARKSRILLKRNASMKDIIKILSPSIRDTISDGFDSSLDALADLIPMGISEYSTGTKTSNSIVPEKWICHEAFLETCEGKKVLDYNNSPLHVMSYSKSFIGEVSREELFRHLKVHKRNPLAVPYCSALNEHIWGLCCSQVVKSKLNSKRYKVCIKTEHSFGLLKVGEVIVPGESDQNILLFAHLDHPAQANDGLSGVVVGIEVIRRLMDGPKPKYTIIFLIVNEGIGLSAWLTDHNNILKKTQTALALDMLGLDYPHVLEHSQKKNTLWGELAFNAVKSVDAKAVNVGPTKKDYEQHESREIHVHFPIHSLYRHAAPDGQVKGVPFPQHHTSDDNASLISEKSLATSAVIVQRILNVWNNKKQGKASQPSSGEK